MYIVLTFPTGGKTTISTWPVPATRRPSRFEGKGCTETSFLNGCKTLTIVVIRRELRP